MAGDVVEDRLDSLTREIKDLKSRLDYLTERFDVIETGSSADGGESSPAVDSEEEDLTSFPEIDSEKVFSWVGTSSLLPRIATVCFILVFALVLRTFTDNDIIGKQLGSFIGMGYAAVLIGWGARLLAKKSRLASVFFISGILLMYSIAWETHVRFESVSSGSVYVILTMLMFLTSLISTRFKHSGINSLAILGTSFLAIIIDLPDPDFISLISLFLLANILVYLSAKKIGRGEWNRLGVFFLTICVWLLWTFKLQVAFNNENIPLTGELAQQWYLPAILVFFLAFMFMSVYWLLRGEKQSIFDILLPIVNVLWAYGLAYSYTEASSAGSEFLGYFGVFMGLVHFGIASYYYLKERTGNVGICSFAVSGSLFMLLALPTALGSVLMAIPIWSLLAFLMIKVSDICEIGGIRLTSYIIPLFACILGIASGSFAVDNSHPYISVLIIGMLALISGVQYYWCRRNPASCNIGYFAVIDRFDRTGVILLAVSLISVFYTLQTVSFHALAVFEGDSANILKGVQSVLINIGAIFLLFLATRNRNKEILSVAVVVIVIGALKVFGHDLFKSHGVPLVFSVLSFGVVAAVGSMVMSRWSQKSKV